MAHNNYFQFKQFRIEQEQAAMKVGIDGVLLGAWTSVNDCRQMLDVGTGTGLIALMVAQRSAAHVTAVEIEKKAAEEAARNVQASPWASRLDVKHCSLQRFVASGPQQFDRIISNPPYFTNGSKAASAERTLARHADSLPFAELLDASGKMLSLNGRLSLILPVEPALRFIDLAKSYRLHLVRLTRVMPHRQKQPHRYLMEFARFPGKLASDELPIRNVDGQSYSPEYKALCKAFYLFF